MYLKVKKQVVSTWYFDPSQFRGDQHYYGMYIPCSNVRTVCNSKCIGLFDYMLSTQNPFIVRILWRIFCACQ